MIFGGLVKLFVEFKIFPGIWEKFISFTKQVVTGTTIQGQGGMFLSSPGVSPAYMGVGYIIGPKLASLNFSGGVLAWGLLTPIIFYFVSPFLNIPEWGAFLAQSKNIPLDQAMKSVSDPMFQIQQVWRFIVRPIAIGGMLVGASFTLYKMRKSLIEGIKRSIGDVKKAAPETLQLPIEQKRTYHSSGFSPYYHCCSCNFSDYIFHIPNFIPNRTCLSNDYDCTRLFLCGCVRIIGGNHWLEQQSNSGLTLTALVVTALFTGSSWCKCRSGGVKAVLGVAAIVCVAAAVAGEMLQDLKAGPYSRWYSLEMQMAILSVLYLQVW